jgi:hypothetical protein
MKDFISSKALSGPPKRVVDSATKCWRTRRRVKALIRIHLLRQIGVRSHLPATEIKRFQAGLDHLHGLAARHRAERGDVVLFL